MTTRDNIIYYTITAIVFVGIVLCCTWFHTSGQNSTDGKGQSLVERIAPYAALIAAFAALISATIAVIVSTRKTRREKIDELKSEIVIMLSQTQTGFQGYTIYSGEEEEKFQNLPSKFKTSEYEVLYQCALDELQSERKVKLMPPPGTPSANSS